MSKIDGGDGCITVYILKATELCTLCFTLFIFEAKSTKKW